jgi:hypothetical protein
MYALIMLPGFHMICLSSNKMKFLASHKFYTGSRDCVRHFRILVSWILFLRNHWFTEQFIIQWPSAPGGCTTESCNLNAGMLYQLQNR